jgi:hypothetical protein
MSVLEKLRGGLSGSRNNGAVLEAARKKLAVQQKRNLDFLKQKPGEAPADDGRLTAAEVADYVNATADDGYNWITGVARPFLRELALKVREVGSEVMLDLCDDESQLNQDRQQDYDSGIEYLLAYGYEQDAVVMEDLEIRPQRKGLFEKLFHRIPDAARLALLVDDISHAEDKGTLEELLEASRYDGELVFTKERDGDIRVFGQNYKLAKRAFGFHNAFAQVQLEEAAKTRSREIAKAHKAEVKEQRREVSTKTETDVSADEFFFGDPDEVNEKTTVISWFFQRKQNTLRLRRIGERIYVTGAIGAPKDALDKAKERLGDEPFVLLDYLISEDGDHLCLSKRDGAKTRYEFGGFVKPEIFPIACWIRTAAGNCLPAERLLPEDETRVQKPESNGHAESGKPTESLKDNAGKEVVNPDVFYFRTTNGGAGTLLVQLPEGFVLCLDEAKDENQEVLAPERQVKLKKLANVRIRRSIVRGEPRITLDDCDDVEAMQELQINGIPGVPWKETGKKGWAGLPTPLPGILSFRYKLACESGELKPKNGRK